MMAWASDDVNYGMTSLQTFLPLHAFPTHSCEVYLHNFWFPALSENVVMEVSGLEGDDASE